MRFIARNHFLEKKVRMMKNRADRNAERSLSVKASMPLAMLSGIDTGFLGQNIFYSELENTVF